MGMEGGEIHKVRTLLMYTYDSAKYGKGCRIGLCGCATEVVPEERKLLQKAEGRETQSAPVTYLHRRHQLTWTSANVEDNQRGVFATTESSDEDRVEMKTKRVLK